MAEPLYVVVRLCSQITSNAAESAAYKEEESRLSSISSAHPHHYNAKDKKNICVWPCEADNNNNNAVLCLSSTHRGFASKKFYRFNRVFGSDVTNQAIFSSSVSKLIHSAVKGFRCTAFAYGYLGTGKTHTMSGSKADPGMIVRCIHHLFEYLEDISVKDDRQSFSVRIGFVHLHGEKFLDLINPSTGNSASIELHEDPILGPHLRGSLTLRTPVTCATEAHHIYSRSHDYLTKSKRRGHSIFTFYIERHSAENGVGSTYH